MPSSHFLLAGPRPHPQPSLVADPVTYASDDHDAKMEDSGQNNGSDAISGSWPMEVFTQHSLFALKASNRGMFAQK